MTPSDRDYWNRRRGYMERFNLPEGGSTKARLTFRVVEMLDACPSDVERRLLLGKGEKEDVCRKDATE